MKLRNIVLTILLLFIPFESLANVSMSGYWNVGNIRNLTLLGKDKTDSSIQMKSEFIKVALYKGFAVIKGEYIMFNYSDKDIEIELGYPENGFFLNKKPEIENIIFNNLDNLKVSVNNKEIQVNQLADKVSDKTQIRSWYIWKSKFLANKETKITVYYLLDNHYAHIKKGYSSGEGSAFAYIIESGKVWKNNIENGLVYISLQDGLSDKDIIGAIPFDKLKYSDKDKSIIYNFTDLKPTEEDNIVIRYTKTEKDFDFNKVKASSKSYYQKIDKIDFNKNVNDYVLLNKRDFSVTDYFKYFFIAIFILLLIFLGLFILFLKKILNKFFKKKTN